MTEKYIRSDSDLARIDHLLSGNNNEPVHLIFVYSDSISISRQQLAQRPNIKAVTFTSHVKKIEEGAFYQCGISYVRFENGFDHLGSTCFAANPLNEVQVVVKGDDKSKWYISGDAFYHCGTPGEQLVFRMEGECTAIRHYAEKNGYLYIKNKKYIEKQQPKINRHIRKFMISTQNMNVSFRDGGFLGGKRKHILSGIDLSIHEQEMIMIIGGSGCGKSTLVKQLFGLEHSSEKNMVTVKVDEESVTGHTTSRKVQKLLQKKVYYAPQFTISNENLTVKQEIQKNAKMFAGKHYENDQLAKLAKRHNLYDPDEKLLNTKVGKISGGQKKKLMLACSEAMDPLIYVFDEPDSGLDEPSAYNIYIDDLRKKQVDTKGKTVIVISHHPRNIMKNYQTKESRSFQSIFTRLIVLAKSKTDKGNLCGTIAFDGTPEAARKFFGLPDGEPYNMIVSKIMTPLDGGSSSQTEIDEYVRRYRSFYKK